MRTILLAVVVGLLTWGVVGPAAAADLKEIGDEAPAGKNATGEDCRVRLVAVLKDRTEYQRFSLYCEGWTVPSGEIRRYRAPRDVTPERTITDSIWQRAWSERLAGCGPIESTQILGGSRAALQECKRQDGGWPVVVATTVVGVRVYTFETFPTNLRVLERAAEVLEGRRPLGDAAAPTGAFSGAIRRAETIVGASGKLIGVQDLGAADSLWRLGKLYFRSSNDAAAEAAWRRLLEVYERLLGPEPPGAVAVLAEIGLAVARQLRFDEADGIFSRAQTLLPKSLNRNDPPLVVAYRSWAATYRGRYDEAVPLARQALALWEPRGSESNGVAFGLATLAHPLRGLRKLDEATEAAERALRILQKPGEDPDWRAFWTSELYVFLGVVLRDQKRYADARVQLERGLQRAMLLFGESPRVVLSLLDLGINSRTAGDLPAALGYFRRAAEVQQKNRAARARVQTGLAPAYLDTLSAAAEAAPAERAALMAEAVLAIQLLRSGDTARALQAMSARVAAADPALAVATRDLQDSIRRRDGARAALARETLRPADQREAGHEESLKRQLREGEEKAEALEGRLQAQFPRYAGLSAQKPLAAAEVAALLRPAEGLLVLLPAAEESWVLLARGTEVHLLRATVTQRELARRVRELRAGIELTDAGPRPFDVTAAHRLYDLLLGPLAHKLAGVKHLLAVQSGALSSLPLGLLVTKAPTAGAGDDYRATAWLARDVAISVLPSVASLRDLRAVAGRSAAPKPFIGFGDPAFGGASGMTRGVAAAADHCRQGATMDADLLRNLPRLPESARELRDIARSLGADPRSVVLGPDATESRVKQADLSQYRVVAFATHGLLPTELSCQSEPGLALSPPATPSVPGAAGGASAPASVDDGLLDASEVAQLKLDADWVLLSACNTATPDGRLAGESLSSLARAFFYAGARALLASHWAVASRATVFLTTGMFSVYARDPSLGRAEALRRSQLALAGERDTSHPFFWAPFVLVGDGGSASP